MTKIKLSSKAYIAVSDLSRIQMAKSVLFEVVQGNSAQYISEEDYQTVMSIFSKWTNELYKRIETFEVVQNYE